jgi:hypothetical protein
VCTSSCQTCFTCTARENQTIYSRLGGILLCRVLNGVSICLKLPMMIFVIYLWRKLENKVAVYPNVCVSGFDLGLGS